MIGVCNSIFPLENLRYAIILVQKTKSSHSKNVVIPDKKNRFSIFLPKRFPYISFTRLQGKNFLFSYSIIPLQPPIKMRIQGFARMSEFLR